MDYYSVGLLVVCLVDNGKPRKRNTCDHQFVVFWAKDEQHAFQRALKWGKKQESRYKNIKGQWVRWAFVGVENVKYLGKKLDGLEIGSVLADHRSKTPIPFNKRFHPKKSKVLYD
jgi:hypothetical protein